MPSVHALQRAEQRYDVRLSGPEMARMEREIEGGKARRVRAAKGGRVIYLVHCPKADRWIPVVWDKLALKIVTVLPEDTWALVPQKRRRSPKYREVDALPDDGEPDAPEVEIHERAPNNILADALERALKERM